MGQANSIIFLVVAAVTALFFRQRLMDAVIEAINNFRGGPPTPMHPLPVNDAVLLRKRRAKAETS